MNGRPPLRSSLDALFAPRSIAIVGVSSTGKGLGAATLNTIRRFGFSGDITIVNPSMTELDGIASVPTLGDVPSPVDLVLMFTGADRVLETVSQSIEIGARAGIVFASGFSEMGSDGVGRQERLVSIAKEAGFRLLGPNCQGVVSYSSRFAATFSNAVRKVEAMTPSPVAYVGQSGAIGGSIFDLGRERGCLPSTWVSTGNQADLDVVEVANYLLDSPDLNLLMLYLEQMPQGEAWEAMCAHAAAVDKRLVLLRSGTTPEGRVAVASHTGALVTADRAFEIVSSNRRVVTVRDVDQMLNVALAHQAGLSTAGRRVAIVSTSGGAGGLAVDAASRAGLRIASLNPQTKSRLESLLPQFASVENPVDVTADLVSVNPDGLGEVCRLVTEDPDVDQLLVVISVVVGRTAEALGRALVRAVPACAKPVTVAYMASRDRTQNVREILASGGVVVFDSVSSALLASGRVSLEPEAPSAASAGDSPLPARVTALTEAEGSQFLERVGIRVPPAVLAISRDDAERAADLIPQPLVLKVQSRHISHKTEVGALQVNVEPTQVGDVFDALLANVAAKRPEAVVDGVLVQSMAPAGVELLVGVQVQQHGFPPLVTVGLGGTSVELYADLAFDTLPVDKQRALSMLRRLRGWPLLDGFRGAEPADIDAAADVIAATGALCELLGEALVEFEINPLIVHERGHGATAVDFVAYLLENEVTVPASDPGRP